MVQFLGKVSQNFVCPIFAIPGPIRDDHRVLSNLGNFSRRIQILKETVSKDFFAPVLWKLGSRPKILGLGNFFKHKSNGFVLLIFI